MTFRISVIHVCVFSQYKWSAEDQTGRTLDLDKVATSTGRHAPNLVVRSGVLQPVHRYTFTLNVSQPNRGQWGSAGLTILPNNPPHGGLCDLSPESDIHLMETVVTFNCSGNNVVSVEVLLNLVCIDSCVNFNGEKPAGTFDLTSLLIVICLLAGWKYDDSRASQLIYTFQVAPCQPTGTKCPLLTLYR